MPGQNTTDLSFYSLVHHVLEAGREDEESLERRAGLRKSYACLQWLAPYRDGQLPPAEAFLRVQCVDLSAGGFSFLADDTADYEYVVVALGTQPCLFVVGEVIRRAVVPFEGEDRVRIACRFINRLDRSYQPKLPPA